MKCLPPNSLLLHTEAQTSVPKSLAYQRMTTSHGKPRLIDHVLLPITAIPPENINSITTENLFDDRRRTQHTDLPTFHKQNNCANSLNFQRLEICSKWIENGDMAGLIIGE